MAYTHASMAWGPEPRASRWGHHAPQLLIAAVASTVALGVLPPAPGLLAALLPALLLTAIVATWVQMRRHDRGLCELCMASMPLDPSLSAERYRRRLALAHLGERPRAVVLYLVALVATDLALVVVPPSMSAPALVLWACMQSSLVYLVLSHVTHRRLQPWCAQCGGGGEGRDDVGSQGPLPVDSRTG